MTHEEELLERTCPLCYLPIAEGCPNSPSHVLAQRDHYWECLKRWERLADGLARENRALRTGAKP